MKLPTYLKQEKSGAWLLLLWIQPKASRSSWVGIHGDWVKIRISAPPSNGKANQELIRFLSRTFNLPLSSIEIVSGQTFKKKIVRLKDISYNQLLAQLPCV